MSGEPVSLSGKKSQMKVEYRLLCDIMAKSFSVKAGSFNAITVEKFSMVTTVVCGVRMNWARVLFNILKKMVTPGSKQSKGFAVQIICAEEAIGAPKPKAVSKKRPAAADFEAPVVKKKRTMNKKSAAEGILTQPAAEDEIPADPPADEVAGVTVDVEAADEGPNEELAAGDATRITEPTTDPVVTEFVNDEPSTADDVDIIIEQVLADTSQISVDEEEQVVRTLGEGNQPAGTAKEPQWFDLPYDDLIARWDAKRPVVTASDTDEEEETMDVGATGGDQQVQFSMEEPEGMEMSDELIDANEKMSLDEILLTIPTELPLPSAAWEYSLFSSFITTDISSFVASIDSERTVLRNVQIAQNTVSVAPIVQLIDEHSSSDSTSDTISMDFAAHDTATTASISLPAAPSPDITLFDKFARRRLDVVTGTSCEDLFVCVSTGCPAESRGWNSDFSGPLIVVILLGIKGEGESSRGPQPPPAVQIRDSGNAGGSGDAVRTTDVTQADIDAANRQILERMMREERERERERRSKSRSGSFKRKRY
ncbi:kinase associated protein phosphatase-maize (ISS) [Dorcoceras hygrometricum]|uniref:Kinase associated protein phosphatase-maize (ISS) n=1 Tax=Dorcoceras hygrometricum TaxID=472368 RepID=A0A2Z7B4Y3_9LAMI|nr:kinase associated protein phosphatase-maize (ISS) [Dorcoceras hygrometricum]